MTLPSMWLNGEEPPLNREVDTCDICGGKLRLGDWPYCPHDPEVNYSFKGDFK